MSDTYKVVVRRPVRLQTYCVTADTVVVRDDGAMILLKAGTLIDIPGPDGPLQFDIEKSK